MLPAFLRPIIAELLVTLGELWRSEEFQSALREQRQSLAREIAELVTANLNKGE